MIRVRFPRALPWISLLLAQAAACASEHQPALSKRDCVPNEFRACHAETCLGVQQCLDPGQWGDCDCVVGDASYAESGADAEVDGDAPGADALPDGDADASSEDALGDGDTDAPSEDALSDAASASDD